MPVIGTPLGPTLRDDLVLNHNTGGIDALRVTTPGGDGIGGVDIRVYLASDYAAEVTAATRRGVAKTLPDGRWDRPVYRNPGAAYVVTFDVPGYEIEAQEIPAAGL